MINSLRAYLLVFAVPLSGTAPCFAVTNLFFNSYQTAAVVATNMTATTLSSRGYLFTYSVDGWWSAWPGGPPTGRFQSVLWPAGVNAQAITAGPTSGTGASIEIRRTDGQPFDLLTFTGKILGNTAGAGAAFELMPQLNGNDAFPNPLTYDATGYAGQSFSYKPMVSGYDAYILSLWMDFALTQLTVVDTSTLTQPNLEISQTSPGTLRLSWPTNCSNFTLLQNSDSSLATWAVVTNATTVVGTNIQVLVSATNGPSFFRLVF